MSTARPHPWRPFTLAVLPVFCLLLGLLVLAPPAAAAPVARSLSLVISEVYAPIGSDGKTQWFELRNTRPRVQYPLQDLILRTSSAQVTLSNTMVITGPRVITGGGFALLLFDQEPITSGRIRPPGNVPVLLVRDLVGLNPQSDALALFSTTDLLIDAVNWGKPQPTWPNYKLLGPLVWETGLAPLTSADGRPRSWGRTPPDRDNDKAGLPDGDWSIHKALSPGGSVGPPSPKPPGILGGLTDWAGGLSSLLLWLAFIIIAVIAYRFERLRETPTYWWFLLIAPSGILFYTFVVWQGFSQPGGALTDEQRWQSFPVLAISAVFCLIAVGIFRRVARGLLEA